MIRYILLVLLYFTTFGSSDAQFQREPGTWKEHFPYNVGIDVTQSEHHIYYATPLSLFSIDKETDEYRRFSKVDGLSDVGIASVKFDAFNQQLIIIYENSNIDIIDSAGNIHNIPDIRDNRTITGSKKINDVYIHNEETAYLSASFGLVEFRLKSLDFGSTIFTDGPMYEVFSKAQRIYAASETGLYFIDLDTPINPSDFSQWSKYDTSSGLPEGSVQHVINYQNNLYIAKGGRLYKEENGQIEEIFQSNTEGFEVAFFSKEQRNLIIGLRDPQYQSKTIIVAEDGTHFEGGGGCINRVLNAIEDQNGKIWYADEWRGIRSTTSYTDGCKKYDLGGPLTSKGSDLEAHNGTLYVASGGAGDNFGVLTVWDGFFIYDGSEWKNYNDTNVPKIKEHALANIYQIAQNNSSKIYLGSYYNGLMSFDTESEETEYFNADNSSIQHPVGENDGERVSGLTFDKKGNLWLLSIYADRPLVQLTKDGNWYNYDLPGSSALAKCIADNAGNIWSIQIGSSGGVLLFSDNGTPENTADDQSRIFSKGNSELTTGVINCITEDLDGNIWVGSDAGPVVFSGGSSAFSSSNDGRRPKVTRDSIVDYLLATQDIRCIAVDGANQKWIGTRNGVFVMSPSGQQEVVSFNTENSPLPHNTLIDLAFDGSNGVMYMSTEKGIVSYQTTTSLGSRTHSNEVYAYPNPVPPAYHDNIYIKGLARDAVVKITDLEGKLVKEIIADGGTAVWDGRNNIGKRAAPGVYLVFSSRKISDAKIDTYVTKIMVIE